MYPVNTEKIRENTERIIVFSTFILINSINTTILLSIFITH